MKKTSFTLSLACILVALPVLGFSTTVNYDSLGAIWYTEGISSEGTWGGDMAGMTVTVTYGDGSRQTVEWGALSDTSGGAWGDDWSLSVTEGSTYKYKTENFQPWVFSIDAGTAIAGLFIDAGPGDTVFDGTRTYGSDPIAYPSTAESYSGTVFEFLSGDPTGMSVATYSGLVALEGREPVGDLYRYLNIDFGGNVVGSLGGTFLEFSADTDNVLSELAEVPEPATGLLFGVGIIGLAAVMRRKVKE